MKAKEAKRLKLLFKMLKQIITLAALVVSLNCLGQSFIQDIGQNPFEPKEEIQATPKGGVSPYFNELKIAKSSIVSVELINRGVFLLWSNLFGYPAAAIEFDYSYQIVGQ